MRPGPVGFHPSSFRVCALRPAVDLILENLLTDHSAVFFSKFLLTKREERVKPAKSILWKY
jgi:hypothetical protein